MSLLIRLIVFDVKFVLGGKGPGKVENFFYKTAYIIEKISEFFNN
jgi:hypothetical protein